MKQLICKLRSILDNRSGETIVEVVVAFALLTIMMVVFTQGLASATAMLVNADENRRNADDSMIDLQNKLATEHVVKSDGSPIIPNNNKVTIRRYSYKIGDEWYVVYEAD